MTEAPANPPARAAVRPASYGVALLLILAVLVLSQMAGEAIEGLSRSEAGPGGGTLVLLALGGAALLGLVVVNARWLWATLGNLRFALALITLWALSSVLGTLVVQRFPNQTDEGYARTFIEATGDFFYSASHVGGGVRVRPEADVLQWFEQQERLFGAEDGREAAKSWMAGATGRLRQQEIREFTAANEPLLRRVLAVVSWLRLPEAFQISVWFKALLALLCTALVVVVIQRWRGEWRQIGWAMAHLGMVVFCIGASVRATTKVDGFLAMHAGETRSHYARKVDPAEASRDPDVQFDPSGSAFLITPLDFELELHRFKTEYPKHLFVSFPDENVDKSWRMTPQWRHGFLQGRLDLRVAALREDAAAGQAHRERPDGEERPALRVTLSAGWLQQPEELVLQDRAVPLLPRGLDYLVQYRRAEDEAQYEQLLSGLGGAGQLWSVDSAGRGTNLGEVMPGRTWDVPGAPALEVRVRDVWPDWAEHETEGGRSALPSDPALELDVLQDGVPAGRLVVFADRTQAEGAASLPVELRFDYDAFHAALPVRYRLLDLSGRPPVLVTFRGDAVADVRDLSPGDEIEVGPAGDRLRFEQAYARYAWVWRTLPAEPAGRTPEDMYYASLPAELVLEARGAAVDPLVKLLGDRFSGGLEPHGVGGIVLPEDFQRGEGEFTLTDDRRGLLVRLVSDHPALSTFPDPRLRDVYAAEGLGLPFRLDYVTNDLGGPLRFTSDVSLWRDGKLLKRALVEPNQPLYLAGFQFSQADFKREDPTYSGFGVVRDPSVSIVYFGMGILTLGVILLFYVSPLVARRRARRTP